MGFLRTLGSALFILSLAVMPQSVANAKDLSSKGAGRSPAAIKEKGKKKSGKAAKNKKSSSKKSKQKKGKQAAKKKAKRSKRAASTRAPAPGVNHSSSHMPLPGGSDVPHELKSDLPPPNIGTLSE